MLKLTQMFQNIPIGKNFELEWFTQVLNKLFQFQTHKDSKKLIWILLLFLPSLSAWAAPVTPDRPGFSTGTATVPPGALQIEAGIQHNYSTHTNSYTLPFLNLRTGINQNIELNLLWDGVQVIEGEKNVLVNPLIGTKYHWVESVQYNLSLLGYLSWQQGRLTPFLGLLWDRSITTHIDLFGTLQIATSIEQGKLIALFQPAIGATFTYNPKWSSFIEIYTEQPLSSEIKNSTMIDGGLSWLPREDIQLDINLGTSLDKRNDNFIGIGIAVRY